jgi:hypothetical protein
MFGIPFTAGALKVSLLANLGLAVLLVASVGTNVWQLREGAFEDGETAGAAAANAELAKTTGKVEALNEALSRAATVSTEASADDEQLRTDLAAIVDRGRERVVVYRDRVKQLPAAACPPGQERLDATNEILK